MLAEVLCHAVAEGFLRPPLRRFGFRAPSVTRYDSMQRYFEDRLSNVATYAALFDRFASFKDKTVIDLGCNRGHLLNGFLQREQFSAIGADINADFLETGRRTYGEAIRFVQTTPTTIPLPDASVDLVYTIDTVEHLNEPEAIFREVHRVLKPGGVFLVHFNPWLNPYGSHLEDIIPFPWPHVLFSMDTLLKVAAKIYESPLHSTACYFLDEQTGEKKPNPYHNHTRWAIYLNRMTIRRFNRLCAGLPLVRLHQERIGFGGKTFKVSRLVRGLAQVPVLDEFFCSALFTVLRKPPL